MRYEIVIIFSFAFLFFLYLLAFFCYQVIEDKNYDSKGMLAQRILCTHRSALMYFKHFAENARTQSESSFQINFKIRKE